MKFILKIAMAILFIVFFGFALKNTQEVALRFFLDYEIRGPLVILLLAFFVAGFGFGVLAMVPVFFRQRRDLVKQQKMNQAHRDDGRQYQPPQPDSILNNNNEINNRHGI
jgi:putative membrane protein